MISGQNVPGQAIAECKLLLQEAGINPALVALGDVSADGYYEIQVGGALGVHRVFREWPDGFPVDWFLVSWAVARQ